MAQVIPLSQGKFAIVDDDDFEKVNSHKWCIKKTTHNLYAKRALNGKTISMHQIILEPQVGYIVDHINGNGLDNRKENLRLCTHSENMKNIKVRKDNSSGVRGVSWNKTAKKWHCQIQNNGKKIYLGLYKDLEEAKRVVLLQHSNTSEFYQTRY
jgi:hypothetical protein